MNPALKRALVMPFVRRKRLEDLTNNMRSPQEIQAQQIKFHEMSLNHDKRNKKPEAALYKAMSDALKWTMRQDESSNRG